MSKIIGLLVVIFLFVGCSSIQEDNITLEEVIQVFEEHMGEEIDRERTLNYSMIGAIDGISFWFGRFPVKISVYQSIEAYERAIETFPVIAEWPRIGLVVLETSNVEAREIFESIGNINNNPIILSDSLQDRETINTEKEIQEDTQQEIQEDIQVVEQQSDIIYYGVGETAHIADWDITFNAFEFSDTGIYTNSNFRGSEIPSMRADEGNTIIIIDAEFMNLGREWEFTISRDVPPSSSNRVLTATLIYDGYFEYPIREALPLNNNSRTVIDPLMSRDMVLQVEVPNIVVESSNSLELIVERQNESVVFKLR